MGRCELSDERYETERDELRGIRKELRRISIMLGGTLAILLLMKWFG